MAILSTTLNSLCVYGMLLLDNNEALEVDYPLMLSRYQVPLIREKHVKIGNNVNPGLNSDRQVSIKIKSKILALIQFNTYHINNMGFLTLRRRHPLIFNLT